MNQNESSLPWYRQRWLWFVLSVPICSVILSSIMVYVAVVGKDSLVSDNYYKHGMEINQTIEQDQLARELSLTPSLTISADGLASVTFSSGKLTAQPFVTLNILHPTVADKDVKVKLLPTETGYMADIPSELSGRRYVDLYAFDRSWRIREEIYLPLESHILNRPN